MATTACPWVHPSDSAANELSVAIRVVLLWPRAWAPTRLAFRNNTRTTRPRDCVSGCRAHASGVRSSRAATGPAPKVRAGSGSSRAAPCCGWSPGSAAALARAYIVVTSLFGAAISAADPTGTNEWMLPRALPGSGPPVAGSHRSGARRHRHSGIPETPGSGDLIRPTLPQNERWIGDVETHSRSPMVPGGSYCLVLRWWWSAWATLRSVARIQMARATAAAAASRKNRMAIPG